VPTGHVVYAGLDASLMAVPFDTRELRPKGTPVALAADTALARLNAPAVAFSHTGTLVRATGYLKGSRREPMQVVASTAARTRMLLSTEAALYARGFALSPDGRRLAISTADNTVWVIDTRRGTRVKLPPAPIVAVMGLLWSLDGRSLLLSGPLERDGYGILLGSADGAGSFERLVEAAAGEREAVGWDPATRALVWLEREIGVETRFMRQEPGAQPSVLFVEAGVAVSGASVSPDGSLVAFDSAVSGDYQVYVRPLAREGARVSVTASGGRFPVWSRDGRTLFFRRGREVRAVAVTATGDGIRFGEERAVLEWDVARSFDVGPDGTFYGVEPVPGAAEQTILELRTGWFADIERLAGPRPGEPRP
jgi:Tol biopolymer transport system component